ncbi:replication protein P [Rahnella sp. ChDrAdgB13]|uniref:replication protein P n=1 Tax=Rahnella sp. ChDrAdgB13 TaxID=1850581 RepID=UPI001AD88872|nr:replication protein P [Rahnella sp. ChDrAdgB13]
MGSLFGDRWISKNGATPSTAWTAAISKFSDEHLSWTLNRFAERCAAGNHWPPDLAEFLSIGGEFRSNPLGLQVHDVMNEYWRYVRDHWRYDSTELFPWSHPVMYQICPELRREGARRNLPERELQALAKRLLQKWIKHVELGQSIPPVRKKITAPSAPTGLTPAQQMMSGKRYVE